MTRRVNGSMKGESFSENKLFERASKFEVLLAEKPVYYLINNSTAHTAKGQKDRLYLRC